MLLNIIETNLQTNDNPSEPFIDLDNGIMEYRFRYPVSISDIKLNLKSIIQDDDYENYIISIYYRLDENDNNPKHHIKLEDVSDSIYTEIDSDNSCTNITNLLIENNGYVELKTKYPIGCKVIGFRIDYLS